MIGEVPTSSEKIMRNPVRPPVLLLVAAFGVVYLVWGSTYWAIRVGLDSFPPFTLGAVRYVLSGAMLLGLAAAAGAGRPTGRMLKVALITGALMPFMGNGAVIVAEQRAPTGLVALVVSTVPLWMVLIEWLRRGGTRPDRSVFIGLAAGTAGIALLVNPSGNGAGVPLFETAILTLGTVAWAFGSVYARAADVPGSILMMAALQMLSAGALFGAVSVGTGEAQRFDPGAVSGASLAALGYLAVFGSVIAYTAYVWLVKVASPASVSTYAYVNPVVALALGVWLGGEVITARTAVAALVLLTAVVLITAGPHLRRAWDTRRTGSRTTVDPAKGQKKVGMPGALRPRRYGAST